MGNDADRYRRFLDGDDEELVVIIDTYYQGLSLYLNSIVKNICEAEEIMQETFVKLAIKKPRFNGKSTFKTWLYAIARNCAMNYLRERSRYADRPIDEAFQLSDETDIEQQYLIEERKIQLHSAMQKLHSISVKQQPQRSHGHSASKRRTRQFPRTLMQPCRQHRRMR